MRKQRFVGILIGLILIIGCSEPETVDSSTDSSGAGDQIATSSSSSGSESGSEATATSDSGEPTWGNLKGRFVFDGTPPTVAKLSVTKDEGVCGKHDLFDESIVVNSENKGIRNVVVYLYQKRGSDPPPIHESYAETENAKVNFDNNQCRFDGHVVGMRTSQTLLIRNLDGVGHNTKIDATANPAINPILPAKSDLEQQFSSAERSPVSVSCSIHPWMKGYLVVQDHPYFAVTDENGEFEITNLPSGDWTFQVWQEKVRGITDVTIDGKKKTWKKGRFTQSIGTGTVDLGDIVVSASQFN